MSLLPTSVWHLTLSKALERGLPARQENGIKPNNVKPNHNVTEEMGLSKACQNLVYISIHIIRMYLGQWVASLGPINSFNRSTHYEKHCS